MKAKKTKPTTRRKTAPAPKNQEPVGITDPEVQCIIRAWCMYDGRAGDIVPVLAKLGHKVRSVDVKAFLEREAAGWRRIAWGTSMYGPISETIRVGRQARKSLQAVVDLLSGASTVKCEAQDLAELRNTAKGAASFIDGMVQGETNIHDAQEAIRALDELAEFARFAGLTEQAG